MEDNSMYDLKDFDIKNLKNHSGKVGWSSPSNIAIVKYWGKYGIQLPRNPSISFTLSNSFTETTIEYRPKQSKSEKIEIDFYFEDVPNEQFGKKIEKFFNKILGIFPFLIHLEFTIKSKNSFPHSAGIASSASSMSAIALCLCEIETKVLDKELNREAFLKKASFVSRLGSGSASRSVYDTIAIWGETNPNNIGSNYYAIPYKESTHEVFQSFHDDILIISGEEKKVSSTQGHALMENNIYAKNRYHQANERLNLLLEYIKNGDVEAFGELAEAEALTLHALMMTSIPPYILMKPNTLAAINRLQEFRTETKTPIYFTLDAGPNLHVLYPDQIKDKAKKFIKDELVQFCEGNYWIEDHVGRGPQNIYNKI